MQTILVSRVIVLAGVLRRTIALVIFIVMSQKIMIPCLEALRIRILHVPCFFGYLGSENFT